MQKVGRDCALCLWVDAAFYLPFISVVMSEAILRVTQSVTLAYDVATAIVFINSSLNPIIYCWRMAQIRLAVINILENFMFCKNWCRLSSPLAARDAQLNQGITGRGATVVITGYVYLEEHSSAEGGRPWVQTLAGPPTKVLLSFSQSCESQVQVGEVWFVRGEERSEKVRK